MSDRVLLVAPNALEASTVRASLNGSGDVAFDIECVFRCSDALQRLRDDRQDAIAAVVLDLYLPDSQGIRYPGGVAPDPPARAHPGHQPHAG